MAFPWILFYYYTICSLIKSFQFFMESKYCAIYNWGLTCMYWIHWDVPSYFSDVNFQVLEYTFLCIVTRKPHFSSNHGFAARPIKYICQKYFERNLCCFDEKLLFKIMLFLQLHLYTTSLITWSAPAL